MRITACGPRKLCGEARCKRCAEVQRANDAAERERIERETAVIYKLVLVTAAKRDTRSTCYELRPVTPVERANYFDGPAPNTWKLR